MLTKIAEQLKQQKQQKCTPEQLTKQVFSILEFPNTDFTRRKRAQKQERYQTIIRKLQDGDTELKQDDMRQSSGQALWIGWSRKICGRMVQPCQDQGKSSSASQMFTVMWMTQ